MQLGSRFCITKLRDEVNSVQQCIERLFSMKGPFQIWSWKFPNGDGEFKRILDAMNKQGFQTRNENRNKMTHVVFLEILIDRLVALIQMASQILQDRIAHHENGDDTETGTIENVVNTFSELIIGENPRTISNFNGTECCSKDVKITGLLSSSLGKPPLDHEEALSETGQFLFSVDNTIQWIEEVERAYQRQSIRCSNSTIFPVETSTNKNTQTDSGMNNGVELSMGKDLLKALSFFYTKHAKFVEDLNIPSELDRMQTQPVNCIFTRRTHTPPLDSIGEGSIYAICRDFDRISKLINSQKQLVERLQDEGKKLSSRLEEQKDALTKEQEKRLKGELNLKNQIKQAQDSSTELRTKLKKVTEDLDAKDIFASALMEELDHLRSNNKEFEKDKATLDRLLYDPLEGLKSGLEPLPQWADCLIGFRENLEKIRKKLSDLEQTYEAQKMENENLENRNMQWRQKHEKLIERMQQIMEQKSSQEQALIDTENAVEELQFTVAENQKNAERWRNQCQNLQDTIHLLKEQMKQTELDVELAKKSAGEFAQKTEEYKCQLQLLAQYPDLNGPVRNAAAEMRTNSVEDELYGQIQANQLRIALLVEQTNRLENAYSRIKNRAGKSNVHLQHDTVVSIDDQTKKVTRPNCLSSTGSTQSTNSTSHEYESGRQHTTSANKSQRNTSIAWARPASNCTNQSDSSRTELWSGLDKSRRRKHGLTNT